MAYKDIPEIDDDGNIEGYLKRKEKYLVAVPRKYKWKLKSKTDPGRFYITWYWIDYSDMDNSWLYCSNCGNLDTGTPTDQMPGCGRCGGIYAPMPEDAEIMDKLPREKLWGRMYMR
jgi:hypothetical protein